MHERDLIREARAALDDLVDLAPKAPSLKSITAGDVTLRHVEPPLTRWRPAVILLAAAAVTLFVVGIASLVGSNVVDGETDGVSAPQTVVSTVTTPTSGMPVEGTWVLTTYVIDGTTKTVDQAALAARSESPAWIGITPEGVVGYTGCNGFNSGGTTPTFDGERLVFGQIVVQARGCLGETPERAMQTVLRAAPEGAAVSFGDDGDTMTLTAGTVVLTFERRDRRFVERVAVWPTSTGRLDCSPDAYLVRTLPDSGRSIDEVLKGVPGVATIEPGDPVSWALDESGVVVAGAAIADVEPPVIRIVACAETYGVRPGVNLAEATRIWVNDLGLAQTSPLVWGDRFVELCSFASPDLGTLAERYLEEDAATSVRSDGSLPTVEQAAQTLEIIQRSTCAVAPSSSTTTPSPTSTTIPATTGIGNQPEITDEVVSPSWVTVDDEDPGGILQTVLDGGEMPQLSDTIVAAVLENLPDDGWTPYLYRATMAGDVPMSEDIDVYLGNEDALSVTWYYRWDDTPGCDICDTNAVPWDNGWMVWTDADPARGVILYYATNPDLPLNARIVFFPDPIEWPEATAEDDPVLRTQPGEAAALARSILDSLADTIPMPDRAAP